MDVISRTWTFLGLLASDLFGFFSDSVWNSFYEECKDVRLTIGFSRLRWFEIVLAAVASVAGRK